MAAIGAHLVVDDPVAEASRRGLPVVQIFLGDPQGWSDPALGAAADTLRDGFAAAGVDVYVHAPYVINVATANNRIRIPSRKLLAGQLAAAASIGAAGLVVHGGHVTAGVDPAEGYDNWRKAVQRVDRPVPLLVENTAGGAGAMARTLEAIGRLWDAVTSVGGDVGFCLDTCHAHAAGIDLADVVDRVTAITGRIDLVHCNNSRDGFGSGRDRHAGLHAGTIDADLLAAVARAANAPVVCETPDHDGSLAADVRWLRRRLTDG